MFSLRLSTKTLDKQSIALETIYAHNQIIHTQHNFFVWLQLVSELREHICNVIMFKKIAYQKKKRKEFDLAPDFLYECETMLKESTK